MIPEGIKRVAVFCIIKSGDQYLLLKRAKTPNQGKFVPVGDKIDPYDHRYEQLFVNEKKKQVLLFQVPNFVVYSLRHHQSITIG